MRRYLVIIASALVASVCLDDAKADDTNYLLPQLLGAQHTFITQVQHSLHSPYSGPLSLDPSGDHARSHTFGAYFGAWFDRCVCSR